MNVLAILLLASGWAQPDADAVERSARRLEEQLIAPCCWRQPLSMHDSEPARIMKEEIRRELAAGSTEAEILAAYEDRYGIQILAEPPARGVHRVLYILPPLVLLAGAALVSTVLLHWRRGTRTTAEPPSPQRLEQIERELASSR